MRVLAYAPGQGPEVEAGSWPWFTDAGALTGGAVGSALPWAGQGDPTFPSSAILFLCAGVRDQKGRWGGGQATAAPFLGSVTVGGEGGEWANTGCPRWARGPNLESGPLGMADLAARSFPRGESTLPRRPPQTLPRLRSTTSRPRECTAREAAARPGARTAWQPRPHRGSVASPSSFHSLRLNKGKVEKLKGSTPASVRAEQWGPVLVVFLY